jgi:hypothetical protein
VTSVKQVQRIGARARRYDHDPQQLADGRWLVTRQWAAHHGDRDVDHIRKVCDEQRRRWAQGERLPDEDPIEVLCPLHPRTRKRAGLLLDVDALTKEIAERRFAVERRHREPWGVE